MQINDLTRGRGNRGSKSPHSPPRGSVTQRRGESIPIRQEPPVTAAALTTVTGMEVEMPSRVIWLLQNVL